MKVWGITDIGLVRKDNQDAYAIEQEMRFGHTICVVCDGMGGTAGGQLASRIGVTAFIRELKEKLHADMTPEDLQRASAKAIRLANVDIRAAAAQSEDCKSMGTTLVSAVSYAGGAVICNVGDSRAYHITKDGIIRVTRDHSVVESMVERGDITAEEARRHPNRNLITRALGPDEVAVCDSYICPLQAGEYILLCTDGLVNTVTDQEMLFEILHGEDPDTCLQRLMAISKSQGAADNVTAVLMQKQ